MSIKKCQVSWLCKDKTCKAIKLKRCDWVINAKHGNNYGYL